MECCRIVAKARLQSAIRDQRRLRTAMIVLKYKYLRVERGLLDPLTLVHWGHVLHTDLHMLPRDACTSLSRSHCAIKYMYIVHYT